MDNFKERRRRSDWMVNASAVFSVVSWLFTIIGLLFIDVAAPRQTNFFTNVFDGSAQVSWNSNVLVFSYVLLVFSIASCITAFAFNMMRMRRKTDRVRKSVIIIGLTTIIGFILFTITFSDYLF